jgi:DNA-binding transcriptional regulator YiaG
MFRSWSWFSVCSLTVNGTLLVNKSSASPILFSVMPLVYNTDVPPKTDQLLAEIKAWCEANEIKQVQLAKMLGVNRSAVTDWYKRRKTPTAEQALTMLEILRKRQDES